MQLYALDNTFPIGAHKAEKGKDYLCPECKGTVRLRGGPSRQIHFYHPNLPKNCRQHQKSLEHLQMQLKLFNLIGENLAQIECPFPEVGRIADLAWHAKKLIFEVQCSSIPLHEAKERISDYQKVGYAVIWILHDKQFNKTNLSAAESFLRGAHCYFTNIDKTGNGIVYDQFEVLKLHRRLFKGPKLTVNPLKIFSHPQVASPDLALPQVLLDRLAFWKCHAQGDLLYRILKEGNLSLSAKQMLAIESAMKTDKRALKRLPLISLIAKSYLSALEWLLRGQGKASS